MSKILSLKDHYQTKNITEFVHSKLNICIEQNPEVLTDFLACLVVLSFFSQFRAQIGSQVFTWVKCYTKFLEGSWKELVCGLRQICTFQSDTMHMYIAHSSVHPDTGNLCQIYATPNSKILFFLIFQGLKGYQRVVGRMNVQQF